MSSDTPSTPSDNRGSPPQPATEIRDTLDYASSGVDDLRPLSTDTSIQTGEYISPAYAEFKHNQTEKKRLRTVLLIITIILLLGGGVFTLVHKKTGQDALQSGKFNQTTIALNTIPQITTSDQAASLRISGQLQADNSIVLAPTVQPSSPVVGQIYFDNSSKQLRYYNGTSFNNLGEQITNITNSTFVTQGSTGPAVLLQSSSPGNTQSGDFNVSGVGTASILQGTNSVITPLIDSSGTLSVGTVNASAISIGKGGITTTVNGALSVNQTTTLSGDLTVSSLGDVAFEHGADYTVTGISNDVDFGSGSLFRLNGASAQTITGITGGTDGRIIRIVNAGSSSALIANDSSNSSASDRITTGTGSDITVPSGASVSLVYDSVDGLWRNVGVATTPGGGGSGSFVNLQASTPGSPDAGNFNISGTGTVGTLSVGGNAGVTGTLTATNLSGNGSAVTNVDAATLQGHNTAYFNNASNLSSGTVASGLVTGSYTGITAVGTLTGLNVTGTGAFSGTVSGANATANNQFVTLSQLNGAVGGISNVSSLNTLVGGLTLQGTSGDVTVTSNGTNTLTLDVGANVTVQGNTFNVANKLVQLDGSGHLPALNGSALTNLNASNLSSGTVASGLVSGSYTNITAVGTLSSLSVTGNLTVGGTGAFTGTVSGANATLNNQFVTLSQLNSAIGGVSDVSSLNTLTGALTVQGTSGQVTVTSNGTNTLTLAVGANVTVQGNSFNGVSQLVQTDGSGFLPALNGSALTALNATNLASGTLANGRLSGAYTSITGVGTLTSLNVSGAATLNSLSVTTTAGVTGNLTVGGTGAFTGTVSGADATASNQFVTLSQLTGGLGGVTPSLQNAYDNSSSPATIVLSSTNKGITLKDASTTVGGNLFAVQDNAGTSTYLGVTTSGVNVAGTFAVTGGGSFTSTVSGADATASNQFVTLNQLNGAIGGVGSGVTTVGTLDGGTYSADGASISGTTIYLQSATAAHTGLVTHGTQTFGGDKTFTGNVAAATLQGDGSGVTNLNASNLATGTVASGLVSGSYTGITAVGTLTSLGVTGNLTVGGTGAFTGTVSGANATLSNQFVTLSQLTSAVGGAVTSLNSLVGGLTIQGTSGDVTVSSNGTNTLTLDTGASVTLQGNSFNGVSQLVKLDSSGKFTAINGSALTNLNASNLATGTVASGLISGAYTGITQVGTLSGLSVTGTGAFTSTVSGADAIGSSDFVTLSQLNSAIGGVGGGVTSLNTLSGALTVQGTTGQITVTPSGGNTLTLALDNSVTLQGNTFNGVGQLVQTDVSTGFLPALNGSALTAINASNIASGTLSDSRLSANAALYNAVTANFTGTLQHSGNNVCDASNNCGYLTTGSASTSYVQLQSSTPGTAQTGNLNISGAGIFGGTLSVGSTATFNGSVTVSSGNSLTIVGGNTASRPASPTEGMVYYDSTTHQLLVYSNGKWQSDRSDDSYIVAASNATQAEKDGADYVATGTADQTVINSALAAAAANSAAGGKVYLTEGTFSLTDSVTIPNNTTLAGTGRATILQFANLAGASKDMIVNTDTSTPTGITVRDLQLDGNRTVNTTGTVDGIHFSASTTPGNGATARQGQTVMNLWVNNFLNDGIWYDTNSGNGTINNNTSQNNGGYGVRINSSNRTNIANNIIQGNGLYGLYISGTLYDVFSMNNVAVNAGGGALLDGTSNNNTISDNNFRDNGGSGANDSIKLVVASNNLVTDNVITDTAGSGNAINISSSSATANYLADNTYSGTGATTLNDSGTGTIYGGQLNGSSAYVLQASGGVSINSATTISGNLIVTNAGNVAYQKGTDYSTTGSSNNVNFGSGALFRLTGASAQTITGIAGGADGRMITLVNAGTTGATISNMSGSSSAANQISTGTGANIGLPSGASISLVYDSGASLWRVIGTSATTNSGISYVTLQGSTPGTADTGNFNISGTGIAANLQGSTSVTTPLLDTVSAGTLSLGTSTATAVSIGKSGVTTTVNGSLTVTQSTALNGSLTVSAAATSLTGATSGDALTVSNSTSTGNIAVFKDNSTTVLTVADGGAVSLENSANSASALSVHDSSNDNIFSVGTSNREVDLGTGSTQILNDPYNTTPIGSLHDFATYVSGQYVQLTSGGAQNGEVDYTPSLGTNFDATFQLNTNGGSNGIALYAYNSNYPGTYDGYDVFFSQFLNSISLQYNGSTLASVSQANIGDSNWHNAEVVKTGNTFNIYFDGTLVLTYTDSSRTLTNTHFGLAGSSGGAGSTQLVRNLLVYTGSGTLGSNVNLRVNGTANIQTGTNSTTAFQIQNSAGSNLLRADTSNMAITVSGATTLAGNLTVTNAGNVAFQHGTDFSTTGSSNDVNFGTGALFRLTGASAQTITGIAGGADGRMITLVNAGSATATIANNSGSSSAANRITTGTGANVNLAVGGSISLIYDSGASLWRVLGTSVAGAPGSYVTLQGSTPGTADTGNLNISGTGIAANLQGTTSVKTALLDTVSAGALNIGTSTATSISIGGSGVTSTFTGTLVVGSGGNTITLTSSGIVLAGNARNAKVIRLPAEYNGAVLDTGATGNNSGTMTSGYDQTNRMNFYKWTTTQLTNQTYDVVVQVPIPKDFDSWNTNPIQLTAYTSDTTNGTLTVQVIKSNGSTDSNFSSFQSATPGSTTTWTTKSFATLDSSGYTAGDYLTIRIRMQSPTSGDVRIGNLVLNYLSNK